MPVIDGIEFTRVLNAVEDLGCDPTGEVPIDSSVASAAQSGTLIEFPQGDYLVAGKINANVGGTIGIRGKTGNRRDVQFHIPSDEWVRVFNLVGNGVLLENVSFQQGQNFDRLISVHTNPSTYGLTRNVEWLGTTPNMEEIGASTNSLWQLYSTTPEGATNVFDTVVKKGPTSYAKYPHSAGFFWTGRNSAKGRTVMRNWHIENSGESGIYAGKALGPVEVRDSYFYNCQHSAIRVTGRNSIIDNCIITIDTDNWHPQNRGLQQQFRGLWCQSDNVVKSGPVVTNTDFNLLSSPNTQGLIAMDSSNGGPLLRNCRIRNETRHPTISSERPDINAGEPLGAGLENCHITGQGTGPLQTTGRGGSYIHGGCISENTQVSDGYTVEGGINQSGCTYPRLGFTERQDGRGPSRFLIGAALLGVGIAIGTR